MRKATLRAFRICMKKARKRLNLLPWAIVTLVQQAKIEHQLV